LCTAWRRAGGVDGGVNRRSGTDLSGIAAEINAQVRGWIGYYGAFYRSELYSLAWRIDQHLLRWARMLQKFKRLRGKIANANTWQLDTVRLHHPACSPTGTSSRLLPAGLREPYDGRPSRPVLREPEGETSSGYSPSTPT
jgi:hypothetical protein